MFFKTTHIFFLILVGLQYCMQTAHAELTVPNPTMLTQLEHAKQFLDSFKNDSANLILNELEETLVKNNQLDGIFGLKVQIQRAIALEQDAQNEEAIKKLLHIVEVAPPYQQWAPQAHAYLSLARLHEKMGRKDACLQNLRLAKSTINQHELAEIYPRFSIRISSYHRIFGVKDSARYYAQEILRTAPQFELYNEEAVGNLLMGLILGKKDYQSAIEYYRKAGQQWERVEDHSGHSAIYNNISKLYLENGQPETALLYCDSSLLIARKSAAVGNELLSIFYRGYQHKGDIYKAMEQLDSAFFYAEKGLTMELDDVSKANNEKVIEIEAKYQDEKKAEKILFQESKIKEDRERMLFLYGFSAAILALLSLLTYFYLRLRRASNKMSAQAVIINQSNMELSNSLEQQILLQAEVHHRVKNNLQVIISLLELHMEENDDPKITRSFDAMINRIYSIASIHEILYQQEEAVNVDFSEYVQNLCSHFSNFLPINEKPFFEINIENKFFNLATSMPLGIILTELLTNSLKYAKVAGQKLRIDIDLKKTNGQYCLSYRDNGPGFKYKQLQERAGGLGTYLLLNISRQLKGHIESKNENGALSQVYFQIKN